VPRSAPPGLGSQGGPPYRGGQSPDGPPYERGQYQARPQYGRGEPDPEYGYGQSQADLGYEYGPPKADPGYEYGPSHADPGYEYGPPPVSQQHDQTQVVPAHEYDQPRNGSPYGYDQYQADPQYAGPRYADPRYGDQQYTDPQYRDAQHVDPQHADMQYANAQYPDSRYAGSQYADPQHGDPQYPDSQYADSRYPDSQYGAPQYSDPRYADPRYADPQHRDPQYGDTQYGDTQYGDPQFGDQFGQSQFEGEDQQPPGERRPRSARGRRRPRKHRIRKFFRLRTVRVALAAFGVFMLVVAWSVGHALTAPGNGTTSDRLAEWARDHYLGPAVTFGEWLTYQPPKVGGRPQFALNGPGVAVKTPKTAAFRPDVPRRLSSPAGAALPGEGAWRVIATVKGEPAMYSTFLRPDSVHTSYVSGIVSMDQRLLSFQLHPGAEDPGPGNWKATNDIPAGARTGLLGTFNGGFKINVSGGGFYLNGVTKGTLTNGAASLVYYRNGRVAVGVWGRDVQMTANVVGVRQNLRLIVDHGAVPASVDSNVESSWGATLGGAYYVWRSGIGITKDGRIVFAYGPALSVRTIADMLHEAGAVEAMQLDINPAWMSFMYYKPGTHPADPTPSNLLPTQPEPADRYYSVNSRDFTAVYAR
jgi:hypothetical protein